MDAINLEVPEADLSDGDAALVGLVRQMPDAEKQGFAQQIAADFAHRVDAARACGFNIRVTLKPVEPPRHGPHPASRRGLGA